MTHGGSTFKLSPARREIKHFRPTRLRMPSADSAFCYNTLDVLKEINPQSLFRTFN